MKTIILKYIINCNSQTEIVIKLKLSTDYFMDCAFIIILCVLVSLTITDLYYGYKYQQNCNKFVHPNFQMDITLNIWLLVQAYSTMLIIIYLISNQISNVYCNNKSKNVKIFNFFIAILLALFKLVWVILGSIIFWGYLYPKKNCSSSIQHYMWFNLIMNYLNPGFIFIVLISTKSSVQQNSQQSLRQSNPISLNRNREMKNTEKNWRFENDRRNQNQN